MHLGAYPGESCFDPNRASWLPYFIDNGNELACTLADVWKGTGGKLDKVSPPPPPPPNIALTSDVSAASNPDAVYAGKDASGNPVYAIPESPQANMDRYRQQLDAWYAGRNPDDPCAHWYSVFVSDCPMNQSGALLIMLALVGGIVLLGGRRSK